jgi:PAS domain S-box-containing protein
MSTDEVTATESSESADLPLLDAAIAILTADHVVMSWNPQAESMTGYTLRVINELGLVQIFEPVEPIQQMLLKVHAGEFPGNERLELRTADGKRLPVDVQCTPLRSLHCSEARLVVVIRQMAPWQEWQRHWARLRVLGRVAGSLSHELRNPLNAIFLHTDIVEEEVRQPTPGDRTQVMRSLAAIKAEGIRLQALMQDYLCLARLSNLYRAPEDLRALVEALILEMQTQFGTQRVTFLLSGPEDLGEVALHTSLFRRALSNIMLRLIEALPQGGTLTLHSWRTSTHLHLSIRDLNNVVPADARAALQTALQATNPEAGVDFGVHVAREIITAHEGQVAVTDEPGTGMMCTVTLPLGTTALATRVNRLRSPSNDLS